MITLRGSRSSGGATSRRRRSTGTGVAVAACAVVAASLLPAAPAAAVEVPPGAVTATGNILGRADTPVSVLTPSGDTLVFGALFGSTTFGGITVTPQAKTWDFVAARLSPAGVWTSVFRTTVTFRNRPEVLSAVTDKVGNVYVTGTVSGTVKLGSLTIVSQLQQPFVAKLTPAGTWAWAVTLPDLELGHGVGGMSVALDHGGRPVVASVSYGPMSKPGLTITRLWTNGKVRARVKVTTWNDRDVVGSLAVDGADNVYVAGSYNGTLQFGRIRISSYQRPDGPPGGQRDAFVAKLSAGNRWLWAATTRDEGDQRAVRLGRGPKGHLVVTGFTEGPEAVFGTHTLTDAYGLFAAGISSAGTWTWATQAALPGSTGEGPNDLAVAADGSATIIGGMGRTAQFGAVTVTAADGYPAFVARVTGTGSWSWATDIGGGVTRGNTVELTPTGAVQVSGTNHLGPGSELLWLGRLNPDGTWMTTPFPEP